MPSKNILWYILANVYEKAIVHMGLYSDIIHFNVI